jgi:hypothetical protein
MFSIAFMMVSTIAFMEGEEGTEAMVEAYFGDFSDDLPASSLSTSGFLLCLCSVVGQSADNVLRVNVKEMTELY